MALQALINGQWLWVYGRGIGGQLMAGDCYTSALTELAKGRFVRTYPNVAFRLAGRFNG